MLISWGNTDISPFFTHLFVVHHRYGLGIFHLAIFLLVPLQVKAFYYDETNFPKSSVPAKDAVHGWFTATTYHRGLYYLHGKKWKIASHFFEL